MSSVRLSPDRTNDAWSWGTVSGTTRIGGRVLALLVVDEHSCECLLAELAYGYSPDEVAHLLGDLTELRGEPAVIGCRSRVSGGPFADAVQAAYVGRRSSRVGWSEFAGPAFDRVARSLCQDERLLGEHASLGEATEAMTQWRLDYNHRVAQPWLGFRTPAEKAASLRPGLACRLRRLLGWLAG